MASSSAENSYGSPSSLAPPNVSDHQPRITEDVYVAVQFFVMALAIVAASGRVLLRVRMFRRLTLDDALLIIALCFLITAIAVSYQVTSVAYWTTFQTDGPGPSLDIISTMHSFSVMDNVSNVFGWGSIFTTKISFLVFLRQLVARVRRIYQWWWVVFAFVVASTPVAMFFSFYICPYFGSDMMERCLPITVPHQVIFLITSCVLDIISDVLILSVPCWLLWQVQIDLRRKLALGTVLCLSIFMIIISVVRVALDALQISGGGTEPDTPWLFFWTHIEAAVAIVMVSLTAFRSMLGQDVAAAAPPAHRGTSLDSEGSKHASIPSDRDHRTADRMWEKPRRGRDAYEIPSAYFPPSYTVDCSSPVHGIPQCIEPDLKI